jgi:transposase
MGKRIYRAKDVKAVDAETIVKMLQGQQAVVGVDIAKRTVYGAIVDERRRTMVTVKWTHPTETRMFVALVAALCAGGVAVQVAMEPSGTYGDPLRYLLEAAGVAVYRVSPKRVSDAAEVFDGVPSMHDPKAAALIARLHLEGASEPWPRSSTSERTLAAAVRTLDYAADLHHRTLNRLEAQLGRHFPEAPALLSLGDATLVRLLADFGGPQPMAAAPQRVREAARQFSRGLLSTAKVDALIAAARTTVGVPMIEPEVAALQMLAAEAYRAYRAHRQATRHVEALTAAHPACRAMRPVVGAVTAAVLVSCVGDPNRFASARAFVKAAGLNLRERSSGRKKGKLAITKRGPGRARRFLWLSVLGLVQRDPVVAAYYRQKVIDNGGRRKLIATTAVMRKIGLALWHVGRGAAFDATKLFDTSRLTLPRPYRDPLNRRRVAFAAPDVSQPLPSRD